MSQAIIDIYSVQFCGRPILADSSRCEFNSNASGCTCIRTTLLVCISFLHAENTAGPLRQALLPVC